MKANFCEAIGQITAACVALLALALPNQAHAQFTGDNQTNIIDGTAINWPGNYYVGSNHVFDAQFILNGGSLTTLDGYVGYRSGGRSNQVVVSGAGSTWTCGGLFIGENGGLGNRLVISDGGKMVSGAGGPGGAFSPGSNNCVIVTGSGSLWTNNSTLYLNDGRNNSLVISNGGMVSAASSGFSTASVSNKAVVTGPGSVWMNRANLSLGGRHSTLIVSNGAALYNMSSSSSYIGYQGTPIGGDNGGDNEILVTGSGSIWSNSGSLNVGFGVIPGAGTNNRLTIANGGSVLTSNVYVSLSPGTSNNLLHVSGGNLTVTNLSGTSILDVRRGSLAFDSGSITIDQLWLTNGVQSILEFNSGTLHSKGTVISNTQACVIGDGVANANLHLLGGVHSFQNGLRIRTNSFLTGCGTINGTVVVDAGGAVHANCTNLVFNSAATNNGTVVVDGAVLETFGTFVNNGKLFVLNGGTTNFHGTFINNGVILNGDIHLAIERDGSGGLFIRYTGAPDVTYRLQRAASVTGAWSDLATNTAPASGLIEYHETSPPPGQSFYRSVQWP
jgi:T5SS/PEP-CTERM-associated repeat protein